jgi:hypothetical protein
MFSLRSRLELAAIAKGRPRKVSEPSGPLPLRRIPSSPRRNPSRDAPMPKSRGHATVSTVRFADSSNMFMPSTSMRSRRPRSLRDGGETKRVSLRELALRHSLGHDMDVVALEPSIARLPIGQARPGIGPAAAQPTPIRRSRSGMTRALLRPLSASHAQPRVLPLAPGGAIAARVSQS